MTSLQEGGLTMRQHSGL